MSQGVRADQALVERGLARSRSLARRLIEDGAVSIVTAGDRRTIERPSRVVPPGAGLEVAGSRESRFASRAGSKLDSVLDAASIDCSGAVALDVGQSTGGFTDCLLARGAARVVGIDVGHGQLAPALRDDPRVRCFERTHVGRIDAAGWLASHGLDRFDLVVTDLSFISSLGLLDRLAGFAGDGAALLMLVKPQFELGRDAVRRGGLVGRHGEASVATVATLADRAAAEAEATGWQPLGWYPSGLRGTDGNQEFFLHARRRERPASGASAS